MTGSQCSISEIHNVELDILKFFRYVCEKHGISYCLTYGTLLGAVRHKGFIPWDDDIDVAIPVEEVYKFCRCFEEENSKIYKLVSLKNEKYSLVPWLKIRRNNTTSAPKKLIEIPNHWGICIDIFPMFPIGDSGFAKALKIKLFGLADTLLRANTAKYADDVSPGLKILGKVPVSFRRRAVRCIVKILSWGDKSSTYISDGFDSFKRKEFFGEKIKLRFENELFDAPKAYDSILTEMYGDYMTLPPENERTGHDADNGEIIWSIDADLKNNI